MVLSVPWYQRQLRYHVQQCSKSLDISLSFNTLQRLSLQQLSFPIGQWAMRQRKLLLKTGPGVALFHHDRSALVFRFVLLPRIALRTCHQLVISCKMIVGCGHYNLCNTYSTLRRHFEWPLFLKELTMRDMIVEKRNCTSM